MKGVCLQAYDQSQLCKSFHRNWNYHNGTPYDLSGSFSKSSDVGECSSAVDWAVLSLPTPRAVKTREPPRNLVAHHDPAPSAHRTARPRLGSITVAISAIVISVIAVRTGEHAIESASAPRSLRGTPSTFGSHFYAFNTDRNNLRAIFIRMSRTFNRPETSLSIPRRSEHFTERTRTCGRRGTRSASLCRPERF